MIQLNFDSVLTSKNIAYLDSVRINQSKIVESLNSLNKTADKILHQDKSLGLVTYDTVFTVVVTLSIFALGFFIDNRVKKYEYKKKQKELKGYFKILLDKITDATCSKLAEMYKTIYENTILNNGIQLTPPKVLTYHFQRVKNINEQDIFKAINSTSSLFIILGQLDFISEVPGQVEIYHNSILQKSNELRNSLKNTVDVYIKNLSEYIDFLSSNTDDFSGKTAFLRTSVPCMHKYFSFSGSNELTKLRDEIIKPIQEIIIQTKIFDHDTKGKEITEFGKVILDIFDDLEAVTNTFCNNYRIYYKSIIDSQKVLIEERAKIQWG